LSSCLFIKSSTILNLPFSFVPALAYLAPLACSSSSPKAREGGTMARGRRPLLPEQGRVERGERPEPKLGRKESRCNTVI